MTPSLQYANRLQWAIVVIISLLFSVSCKCGCQPKPLANEVAPQLFSIDITKAEVMGIIKSENDQVPTLRVQGNINLNEINDDALSLYVLVKPDNGDVKEAIEAFKTAAPSVDKDKKEPIEVSNTNSTFFYIQELSAKQTGDLSLESCEFKKPLPPGNYHVYLLVDTGKNGTYYSLSNREFTIAPINATSLQVEISRADSRIVAPGDTQLDLMVNVKNLSAGCEGGVFIFPQGDSLQVDDIVKKWVNANASPNEDTVLHVVSGNVIGVSFPAKPIVNADNMLNPIDKTHLLKGGTYQARAWVRDPVTNSYCLSLAKDFPVEAIIKVELQIDQEPTVIHACRYVTRPGTPSITSFETDPGLNSIQIDNCSIEITKKENMPDGSTVGFIFVKSGTSLGASDLPKYLWNDSHLVPGSFYKEGGADVILYTVTAVNSDFDITNKIAPMGGKLEPKGPDCNLFGRHTYDIHAWVKAGKKYFISTNNKSVKLGIAGEFAEVTKLTTEAVGSNGSVEQEPAPHLLLTAGGPVDNTSEVGYVLVNPNTPEPGFTVADLQEMIGDNPGDSTGLMVNRGEGDKKGTLAAKKMAYAAPSGAKILAHDCSYDHLSGLNLSSDIGREYKVWVFYLDNEGIIMVGKTSCQFSYVVKGDQGINDEVTVQTGDFATRKYRIEKSGLYITRLFGKQEQLRCTAPRPTHPTEAAIKAFEDQSSVNHEIVEALKCNYKLSDRYKQMQRIRDHIAGMETE